MGVFLIFVCLFYIWLASAVRDFRAQADLYSLTILTWCPHSDSISAQAWALVPFMSFPEYNYTHPCHQFCFRRGSWTYSVDGLVSKWLFGPVSFAVALAIDHSLDLLLLLIDIQVKGKSTADHTYILITLWSENLS